MRIKHYYYFDSATANGFEGGQLDSNKWDDLRTAEVSGPFSIEKDRKTYVSNCELCNKEKRYASEICKKLHAGDNIVSLGIGKGILEYHIKKENPEIHIYGSDYTQKGINLLFRVADQFDALFLFDIVNDDFNKLGGVRFCHYVSYFH